VANLSLAKIINPNIIIPKIFFVSKEKWEKFWISISNGEKKSIEEIEDMCRNNSLGPINDSFENPYQEEPYMDYYEEWITPAIACFGCPNSDDTFRVFKLLVEEFSYPFDGNIDSKYLLKVLVGEENEELLKYVIDLGKTSKVHQFNAINCDPVEINLRNLDDLEKIKRYHGFKIKMEIYLQYSKPKTNKKKTFYKEYSEFLDKIIYSQNDNDSDSDNFDRLCHSLDCKPTYLETLINHCKEFNDEIDHIVRVIKIILEYVSINPTDLTAMIGQAIELDLLPVVKELVDYNENLSIESKGYNITIIENNPIYYVFLLGRKEIFLYLIEYYSHIDFSKVKIHNYYNLQDKIIEYKKEITAQDTQGTQDTQVTLATPDKRKNVFNEPRSKRVKTIKTIKKN